MAAIVHTLFFSSTVSKSQLKMPLQVLTSNPQTLASTHISASKYEYNGQSRLIQPVRMKGRRILPLVAGGSQRLTYKDAGVDINAGAELVRRIAKMAPGIGGFGGLFPFGILLEPLPNIYLPLNLKIFNCTH